MSEAGLREDSVPWGEGVWGSAVQSLCPGATAWHAAKHAYAKIAGSGAAEAVCGSSSECGRRTRE